jgi:signal transduction histidine kinase/DNA-binding NarL/FixJ family response regulator/HPt (histidine-containing phosphotransfer) domain-containing protein
MCKCDALRDRWRRIVLLLVALLFFFALSPECVGQEAVVKRTGPVSARRIKTFRDIPGLTRAQTAAAEKALEGRTSFVYGMRESSECFPTEGGDLGGFAVVVADRLSELFGVRFEPRVYSRMDFTAKVLDGEAQFSGDYTPLGRDTEKVFKTSTIVERVIKMVTVNGLPHGDGLRPDRPVRYAFQPFSTARALVSDTVGKYDFAYETVEVATRDEALRLLRSGGIDAFVADSTQVDDLVTHSDLVVSMFKPLTYKRVSITTALPELAPLIEVLDAYLRNGGLKELNELYVEGETQFKRHAFLRSLAPAERAWYEQHIRDGEPILVGVSPANYPVNFYNRKEKKWEGIAFDVIAEIRSFTGMRFMIANDPSKSWSDVFAMLGDGTVPMVAELLRTKEREDKDLFLWTSAPYSTDSHVLISRSEQPNISVNQILYAKIGLVRATGYTEMFHEWFPDIRAAVEYDDIYAAFDGLDRGDVDFIMATENRILAVTNYMERSGFKINLIFDYTSDSRFGFGKDAAVLADIIAKAQRLVDTGSIANSWKHITYDYEKTLAKSRNLYMTGICILFGCALALTGALFWHRRNNEARLKRLVAERTVELKEQTEVAKEASHAKSAFLAKMSHEMRTPLNAVIGLSELSLSRDCADEELRSNIEKVYNSGSTLLSLVNDLLDLSKIESGEFKLAPVDYDIPSLVNDLVTLNIMRIGSKPIEFQLDLDENLPARLFGDELRIKQVFNNLLSNAFKYTNEGSVTLRLRCARDEARPQSAWLTGEVTDTGLGIKQEDLPVVFGEYKQVDVQKNRKIEGTGLGLAITKKMVEMMDGTITVESVYGEGSTFRICIAQGWVTDDVIGAKVAENLAAFSYVDHKRNHNAHLVRAVIPYARVLVVDDVSTNLDVARGLLKPYGMTVDTVMSGQAAVDLIRKGEPAYNAVFMDHMMPGMDGVEATRIIKEEIGTEYAKNIPIIVLTANAIVGNEEMFLGKGFQDFLAKPIDIMKLDNVVTRWVRDKKLERELAAEGLLPSASEACTSPANTGRFEGREVAGVNLQEGLTRFGGDEDAYLNVLRSFVRSTPELIDKTADLAPDALGDYAITVHGMKSASRNVGAAALGDQAEVLEKAAKAGDFFFVEANNAAFTEAARDVVSRLGALVGALDGEHRKGVRHAPDPALLESLREAALEFDIDGVDGVLAALDLYDYEEGGELLDWVRDQVAQSGFAQIARRLEAEAPPAPPQA